MKNFLACFRGGRSRLLASLMLFSMLAACSEGQEDESSVASVSGVPERPSTASSLTVTDDQGQPLAGAMVTATHSDGRRVTRFTNSEGVLIADTFLQGVDTVSVQYPGFAGRKVSVPAVSLVALQSDEEFLKALPSSQWLSLLPEGAMKREFTVNCGTCHEISYDRVMINGKPRTKEQWQAAFAMMRAMDAFEVIPPDFEDEVYSQWLAENLSAQRIAGLAPQAPANPEMLAQVEITEYELPRGDSLPHDLVVGPDRRIWITAFFYDALWALEPDSGAIEEFSVDHRPEVNAQPRALEFDARGALWVVNGGTQSVLRFDPSSGEYEEIAVDMYAHSVALDAEGNPWVNDYFAAKERVARVDARSGEVSIMPLPAAGRPASEGLPLPYGLQVDGEGRLYSTQLAANTLVMFDTKTSVGRLFDMPVSNAGPRRPGLAPDQRLWIPEFNTGYLSSFDPETTRFERVRLGTSSAGLYDVEVNQDNGDIWVTGSLDSSLIRYRPDSGDTLVVPFPTEPAYTRHIAVDESSGDVWTAYSSMPAATPRVARIRMLPRD